MLYIGPIDVDVLAQTACAKQVEIERNKYQAIIDASLDGFWIINLQGEFLECNNAYCELIGYSREELLKMRIADIEANDTEEDIACRISSIISTGHARFLTHHLHKNGTKIPVHISATYLDTDGPTICTFIQDRTESENSFKALQESTKLILEAKQNVISISEQTLREIITGAAMLAEAISGDANSCGIKCQISGEISRLLKAAVKRIRSISHGLYPVELQNNGLLPMISSLIERINSNFEVNISMTTNAKNMHFNETESLHIYRIIQEGINNIVRHSQATQASIIFTKRKTNYLIELSDNGRGLPDSNEILRGHSGVSGLGLQSIQFRAKKIGADVLFENQLTGGLSIKLTLPIIS